MWRNIGQTVEPSARLRAGFYPGKNLGAYGEGGALVTNDAARYAPGRCAAAPPSLLPRRDRLQLPDGGDSGGGARSTPASGAVGGGAPPRNIIP